MTQTDVEILLEMFRDRAFVEDCRTLVQELADAVFLLDYLAAALGPDVPLLLRARDGEVLASRNLQPGDSQAESCTMHAWSRYSVVIPVKNWISRLEELLTV